MTEYSLLGYCPFIKFSFCCLVFYILELPSSNLGPEAAHTAWTVSYCYSFFNTSVNKPNLQWHPSKYILVIINKG